MTQTMPDIPPRPGSGGLSRTQKAAVVVRLLMMGGADPGLSSLPRDQQRRLVREMAALRFVDRQTLAETVAEFSSELDAIGLHFPRDVARILQTLDGALSQDVVEALMAETGGDPSLLGDTAWKAVSSLEVEALLELAGGETDEVCAVLLSKLAPDRAAALLAALPDERSDAVSDALARTEAVTPDAVARIGSALGGGGGDAGRGGSDRGAAGRVAAMLNVATSAVRRAVLDRLDATEPDFAARVRDGVFSWDDIPDRLDPRDVPKVLRGVDGSSVVPALSQEEDPATAFVLGSISNRMAEQLREQIEEEAPHAPDAVEEARMAVVAEIRRLDDAGEVSLIAK